MDTRSKLKVHKTFIWGPERHMNNIINVQFWSCVYWDGVEIHVWSILLTQNLLSRFSALTIACLKESVWINFLSTEAVVQRFPVKFTAKGPVTESLFFNQVAGLRPATLSKTRLWHMCFPVNFAKFLRTLFFHRIPLVAAYPSKTKLTKVRSDQVLLSVF